jgi:RCC1 and BTB domain-containing protein
MENISNWDLLRQLDQKFISNMALVSIFGETGNKALIVTNDDNVFILNDSNNESSVQSVTTIKQIRVNIMREQSKVKVNELCNKQIIDIAIGDQHLIALTKFGQCYIWDIYELLGNGTKQWLWAGIDKFTV